MKKIIILILILLIGLSAFSNYESFIKKYISAKLNNKDLAVQLSDTIIDECEYLNIDPLLILAIIQKESSFRNIYGDSGDAVGFMQIHEIAAKHVCRSVYSIKERYDMIQTHSQLLKYPILQLRIGINYLYMMQEQYGYILGIAKYNGGSTVNKYVANVLNIYSQLIVEYNIYSELYTLDKDLIF